MDRGFVFLQAMVADHEGLPAEEMVIYCAGRPLEDEVNLSTLEELTTFEVEVRMLGGKFSIAK